MKSMKWVGVLGSSAVFAIACSGSTDGGSKIVGGAGAAGAAGSGFTFQMGGDGGAGGAAGGGSTNHAGAAGSAGSVSNAGSAGSGGAATSACPVGQVLCNGSCLGAVNQPLAGCTALLLEQSQTMGLAVDDSYLYFGHADESVDRLNLTTLAIDSLVTGLNFPHDFVLDGGALYFLTDWTEKALGDSFSKGTLRSVPKAGGKVTVLALELDSPKGLTLVNGTLYFLNGQFDARLNSEATTATAPMALGGVFSQPIQNYWVDGSSVYFSFPEFSFGGTSNPGTFVAPLADPTQSKVVADGFAADEILGDAANLYLFESHNGSSSNYASVPKSGGTPKTLSSGGELTFKYRDGDMLYFADFTAAGVQHLTQMPLTGGTPEVFATFDHNAVRVVTADAKHVYVGLDFGGIVRLDK